ncbi:MAG: glycogen synthase GlgA [Thermoanaerobaculaceae bacterium]
MRIAHLASEVVPFSKTGGLADVAGSLPPALVEAGHEVTVVAPGHRESLRDPLAGQPLAEVQALGLRAVPHLVEHRGVRFILLDCPVLYARPALYGLPDADFPDNHVRFAFFARAALTALGQLGGVEIVHAHDWQAALAPFLLAYEPGWRETLPLARSVFTIHNLAYQGVFPPWTLAACGLGGEHFQVSRLEFYGQVNFLKAGLVSADAITTVSPTYAREILTPAFGCQLEGVLGGREHLLSGILNGLDQHEWDPSVDALVARPYGVADAAAGKAANREALAAELGIEGSGRALCGMVSRLAEQKGADLVVAALEDIVALGFDLVVLGTGERRYEEAMRAAELAHPGRVRVVTRFDNRLAHLIYAASDLFLMPSRYEPCGLGQMIAMRYGTLPVVHATGGLADTVVDSSRDDATGFVFWELTPAALVDALARAAAVLARPDELVRMRRTAMTRDFSWSASARAYLSVYERIARQ